jgi:uncharacterized membrane protein
MNKTRLEAFSDGVLAIIITIMVLEMKVPARADWGALWALHETFVCYFTSFLFVGIYWGNHHNLLHAVKTVNAGIMLANLNLLFWLSLLPFATNWMGVNDFAPNTIILYAVIAMCCGLSYTILQHKILKSTQGSEELKQALKKQTVKGFVSVGSDCIAICTASFFPVISVVLFIFQSVIWLVPDKNLEKALRHSKD